MLWEETPVSLHLRLYLFMLKEYFLMFVMAGILLVGIQKQWVFRLILELMKGIVRVGVILKVIVMVQVIVF